jgi:hypothetical protein
LREALVDRIGHGGPDEEFSSVQWVIVFRRLCCSPQVYSEAPDGMASAVSQVAAK